MSELLARGPECCMKERTTANCRLAERHSPFPRARSSAGSGSLLNRLCPVDPPSSLRSRPRMSRTLFRQACDAGAKPIQEPRRESWGRQPRTSLILTAFSLKSARRWMLQHSSTKPTCVDAYAQRVTFPQTTGSHSKPVTKFACHVRRSAKPTWAAISISAALASPGLLRVAPVRAGSRSRGHFR